MRGSHGVCDCDILRRANVKADLYLLRGGFVRTLRTPPGYGHANCFLSVPPTVRSSSYTCTAHCARNTLCVQTARWREYVGVCIAMPTRKVQTREKIPKTPAVKNATVSEKIKTELCVLCCQKVLDCKEDVIHCSGKCNGPMHRYCAGISLPLYESLKADLDSPTDRVSFLFSFKMGKCQTPDWLVFGTLYQATN